MPFRTLHATVGEAAFEKVYTAEAGDVEVQVHSGALPGQAQSDNTYNFYIAGGKDELGLLVVNGEFRTEVDDGDEVWLKSAGGMSAWTHGGMPVTLLVRSHGKSGRRER